MHLEVDQKYYLRQKEVDGLVPPVLDSLDNYKILSERMNVLTIYLPFRKIGIASDLRKVKTAVPYTRYDPGQIRTRGNGGKINLLVKITI